VDNVEGRWTVRKSLRGHDFWCWEIPLPRIPRAYIDACVFLYPSVDAARDTASGGGTGFIIGVPTSDKLPPGTHHIYMVTNDHVAHGGAPVVRINLTGGGFDVLPLSAEHWRSHPEGDDLALCPLNLTGSFRYKSIGTQMLLDDAAMSTWRFGPGDDTFIIGRYVNLDGQDENRPTVRFGAVSALPQLIYQSERGFHQESFLVESRSLAGYSGSPVFVWISGIFKPDDEHQQIVAPLVKSPIFLLGIDWGHHPWREPVRRQDDQPMPDGSFVRGSSGMMMVIPSWKLPALLDDEELVEMRKKAEEKYLRDNSDKERPAVMDVAPGVEPETHTRDEFISDLIKVTESEARPHREE
jgi:hypothetical protein